jgi:hypothetical protein
VLELLKAGERVVCLVPDLHIVLNGNERAA